MESWGGCSSIWPNNRILIANPLSGEAGRINDRKHLLIFMYLQMYFLSVISPFKLDFFEKLFGHYQSKVIRTLATNLNTFSETPSTINNNI